MAGEAAIPVTIASSTAFTPTAAGAWAAAAMLLIAIVKAWPILTRLRNESDASLRSDLLKRISTLEAELMEERRKCDERLAGMQAQIDGLHRQIIAFQVSSGRAFPLPPTETNKAIERLAKSLGNEQ